MAADGAIVPVATPREDGASMLQRMESGRALAHASRFGGRVVGVVSKDSLLRLLARSFFPEAQRARACQR